MPEEVTEVEEITVVGQRRTDSATPFPRHPHSGAVWQQPDASRTPDEWENPCASAERKREWDTDAAAAEAMREFMKAAQARGEQLGHREQTALLHQPGGGVVVGPIGTGPIGTGSAPYITTGIDMRNVRGLIHNHPGGTLRPSALDWGVYDRMVADIRTAGGAGSLLMYIIGATYPPGGPAPTWRISYTMGEIETSPTLGRRSIQGASLARAAKGGSGSREKKCVKIKMLRSGLGQSGGKRL